MILPNNRSIIICMSEKLNPVREKKQVDIDNHLGKIFIAAADVVKKTVAEGFGDVSITISIRHGAICEPVIRAGSTTTVKL